MPDEGDEKKVHGFDVEVVQTTTVRTNGESDGKHELHLYNDGKKWQNQRESRLARQREEKRREEVAEIKKPWVTDMAKEMSRDNFEQFLSFQAKWSKENDGKKRHEQQKATREREDAERPHLEPWDMSKGSREIIEKKSQLYNSPSSRRGWRRNLARFIRAKERDGGETPSFSPRINEVSRRLDRRTPVGDRLHSLHEAKEEDLSFRREGVPAARRRSRTSSIGSAASRGGLQPSPRGKAAQPPPPYQPAAMPRADDFSMAKKGASFEAHEAKARVAELAEALDFEIERNKAYDRLSREVQKEADYLTDALRKERERNDLLLLELHHERARGDSLEASLSHHLAQANVSRNIGEPLVKPSDVLRQSLGATPSQVNGVSLTLSPRRFHPTANDTGTRQTPASPFPVKTPPPLVEINLDDL